MFKSSMCSLRNIENESDLTFQKRAVYTTRLKFYNILSIFYPTYILLEKFTYGWSDQFIHA